MGETLPRVCTIQIYSFSQAVMRTHRETCKHREERSAFPLKICGKISSCIQTDTILEIQFHLLTEIPTLTQQMWTAAISLPLADCYILLPSVLSSGLFSVK